MSRHFQRLGFRYIKDLPKSDPFVVGARIGELQIKLTETQAKLDKVEKENERLRLALRDLFLSR